MKLHSRFIAAFTVAALVATSQVGFAETNTAAAAEEAGMIDDGNFLLVDYDQNLMELTSRESSAPENTILEDSNKNRYMEIKPGWKNWGYMLKTPLPNTGGDVVISFDFMGQDLSPSYYTVSLVERATMTGENVYHQFGLLKPVANGNFMIAGSETSGMKYENQKWYHYRLVVDLLTKNMEVEITDKKNPDNKATYTGPPSAITKLSTNYGNGIRDRNYDAINFGISGTLSIDNLQVEESRAQVISFGATSEHVGNIFDEKDAKTLDVSMRNVLLDPVEAEITYEIYDDDDNFVESGNAGNVKLAAREQLTQKVNLKLDRFGLYKIYFAAKGTNKTTGEAFDIKGGDIMLSVANKVEEGSAPNPLTAINVPYIYEDTWPMFKELLLQAGISSARKDFTWYHVESYTGEKGQYIKNPKEHSHYQDMVDSGIENMAILMASNPLYSESGTFDTDYSLWSRNTPEMWEAFERYVEYVTKEYKDKVTYWEILNEPNERVPAEMYVKLMKLAYPIIKKNDPDGIVLGLCTASMPWTWIEEVIKLLSEEDSWYMDILTVHPYDFDYGEYRTKLPNTLHWSTVFRDKNYEDKMIKLRELMDKYGCDLPIHLTEVAITSTPLVSSMKRQGADLTHVMAVTQEQELVDKVYWYCLENITLRGNDWVKFNDTETNFGLVGYQGDPVPLAAKGGYLALCAYNNLIHDSQVTDKIIDGYTRAYRFKRKDGSEVIMMWCDEGSSNISLDLGTDEIEIFDMYSNSEGTIKSKNGVYDFSPSFEPIYIKGDFKRMQKSQYGSITVDNSLISAVTNDTAIFNINDTRGRDLKVVAKGTPHAVVAENNGIKYGKGRIVVNTTDTAFEEEPITIKVYDGDNMVYYARYFINIKDVALKTSYKQEVDVNDENRNVISFSVSNETAGSTLTGDVVADFSKIGGKEEKRSIYDLKPGETKTVYLNVPATPYIKSVATTAKVNFGDKFAIDTPISVINDMTVAYNDTGIKDASVFDGNYKSLSTFAAEDELAADSYMSEFKLQWGGPDDCSFKGTLLWDEEKLYILCDVKDNAFYQKESGTNIWQGDCLQIGFQDPNIVGVGLAGANTQFCELGVTMLDNGQPEYYRWSAHPGTSMQAGRFENCDVIVERTNGRTVYKIAIPWIEAVGRESVSEGDEMKFNIIANDNDGAGRRGFAVLTKGIGESKNATLFGNIKLVK